MIITIIYCTLSNLHIPIGHVTGLIRDIDIDGQKQLEQYVHIGRTLIYSTLISFFK